MDQEAFCTKALRKHTPTAATNNRPETYLTWHTRVPMHGMITLIHDCDEHYWTF